MQIRIRSRCPNDPFRQLCPYCKGAGYFERWLPLGLVGYVVGGMSYIILGRRKILPQAKPSPPRITDDAELEPCRHGDSRPWEKESVPADSRAGRVK